MFQSFRNFSGEKKRTISTTSHFHDVCKTPIFMQKKRTEQVFQNLIYIIHANVVVLLLNWFSKIFWYINIQNQQFPTLRKKACRFIMFIVTILIFFSNCLHCQVKQSFLLGLFMKDEWHFK